MDDTVADARLKTALAKGLAQGDIAEYSLEQERIRVRPVGHLDWLFELQDEVGPERLQIENPNSQFYYFLAGDPAREQELRPGSGIIRVFGGKPEGPGGTLTCFLSTLDGGTNYFAAAAHVLTNFWHDRKRTSRRGADHNSRSSTIYRYQKGFPATGSRRFLGNLDDSSAEPLGRASVDLDLGIVKLRPDIEPTQRTTCYGTFDDSKPEVRIEPGLPVMKCGAEETHHTYSVVAAPSADVSVYGPLGVVYRLTNQVILELPPEVLESSTNPPRGWTAASRRRTNTIFAVPGDSGTLIVTQESRKPVGMLVAGSILDGRYVMTPFSRLKKFWEKKQLILRRG